MSVLATTLAVVAIVTADQSALRAAPRDSAAPQAQLWQGDSLEIRGQKGDFLQVYDHRRERPGYVRASQVRVQSLAPEAAPELLAVLRFLKDQPGAEALGIGYAAAYLKAAPAGAIGAEVFDALGGMAERLAERASAARPGRAGEAAAAHLEVAAAYGVTMTSFEREGRMQLCYEGEAQRRVLALPAGPSEKARAALALTRHECVAPSLTPTERHALDTWRAEVLDRVETASLPPVLQNRLHLRKAGVWASLAWQRARRPDPQAVGAAGRRAVEELAAVDKAELMESDAAAYAEAAIRVGASRWAAAAAVPAGPAPAGLEVVLAPGQPGETCVHLLDARHAHKPPLATRCTYSVVWPASAAASRDGKALSLAVQPLDAWREMWVFRQAGEGWTIDVQTPAPDTPGLGYVEFAGWVPGKAEMLAAREVVTEGGHRLSFELLSLNGLETRKKAEQPSHLSPFYRWQDPLWKAGTVSLR